MAPSERPGLAAAHLFLVLACLRGESGLTATDAHQLAATHLEHLQSISEKVAKNGLQTPPELHYLEGLLMLRQGQIAEAHESFQELSRRYWPAAVTSLEISTQLGRKLDSQVDSEMLIRWTQSQPAILDELSSDCFAIWYRTEKSLGDPRPNSPDTHNPSQFIAEHWLLRFPANSQAAEAFLDEYSSVIERLAFRGQVDKRRAAILLNMLAGRLGVQHRDQLGQWLIPRLAQAEEFAELGEVLGLAARTNPPAVLLEIMGTDATARGELASAQDLLDRAVKLDPYNGVAWNNLAVVSKRRGLIASAFEAANQAVGLEPNNDAMRLTRGIIAFELDNWEMAQKDLERVSQNQPDNREVHRYLAIAYERLGKTDKSSFHQLLAGR
jgi:Flp pilus assembly protein TadD